MNLQSPVENEEFPAAPVFTPTGPPPKLGVVRSILLVLMAAVGAVEIALFSMLYLAGLGSPAATGSNRLTAGQGAGADFSLAGLGGAAGTGTDALPASGGAGAAQDQMASGNENNFNTYNNPQLQNTSAAYVLNTSSMIFHYSTCADVRKMSEENYATSDGPRDEIINQGYRSCGHCNP